MAASAAFSAVQLGLPAIGPALKASYDLSLPALGVVLSVVSLGMAASMLPWGVLSDRVGDRPTLVVGLVCCAISLVVPIAVPTFAALLAGLLLAGVFGSVSMVAGGRAVVSWFPTRERGLALSLRQTAIPLGAAVGVVTLPLVAGGDAPDRALAALACGCVVTAVGVFAIMRPSDECEPPPESRGTIVLRDGRLWRLALAGCGLQVAQMSLLSFLVVFLHDQRGLPVGRATVVAGGAQLGGAIVRVGVGWYSDHVGLRVRPMRSIAPLTAVLIAAIGLSAELPTVILAVIAVTATAAAMSWNGVAFTLAAEFAGPRQIGSGMGFLAMVVTMAAAVTPLLFAAVVELSSWSVAFAIAAIGPLAAWVCLGPLERGERSAG